jgi:hypothetical protein
MAQLLESNLPIEKTKHAPLHAGQQGGMEALLTQWKHVAPWAAGAAIWKDGEDFATPLLSGVAAESIAQTQGNRSRAVTRWLCPPR